MTYKELENALATKQITKQEFDKLYAEMTPGWRVGHCTVSNCLVEDKPLPLNCRK